MRQQQAGLVGAMIVQGGPATPAPDDYEIFLKGAMNRAPTGSPLEIGGLTNPDTLVIRAGRPARFRFMSLTTSNASPAVVITARADSVAANVRDTLVTSWVPLAKDGADLPAGARLEVRGAGRTGVLLGRVPIRVE